MEIFLRDGSTRLPYLSLNLYADQEATIRIGHGTMDWFEIGKGVCQGYILSLCLFNYMLSRSCKMPGWVKHKLKSRLPGEISKPHICRWYHTKGRKWRGTKEPLVEGKRGELKTWLETQLSKNSWYRICLGLTWCLPYLKAIYHSSVK